MLVVVCLGDLDVPSVHAVRAAVDSHVARVPPVLGRERQQVAHASAVHAGEGVGHVGGWHGRDTTVGVMRVISGSARGRRLDAPPGLTTRPTLDRVREAMFNALGSLRSLQGVTVVDLFGGSGALGIEALSRGAAFVTFCDTDRIARQTITANLERTGFTGRATVLATDAVGYAMKLAASGEVIDLAIADPPFRFEQWDELLAPLPADLLVAETDRELTLPAPWEVLRFKRYGGAHVYLARRIAASRPDDPAGGDEGDPGGSPQAG